MSVSEHDRIQLAALDLCLATVFRAFLFATLEETTVNKNARVLCDNLISRPGYVTRCSKKTNSHNLPSCVVEVGPTIKRASATQLHPACRFHVHAHSVDRRSACS